MHDRTMARLTSADIRRQALALGFDVCGVAPANAFPELTFFREWVARGYAGEMHYLERSADRRSDVRAVMPSARCVISLGSIYNTDQPYSIEQDDPRQAAVARYAWGDDYHTVIERRLGELVAWMRSGHSDPFEARAYVDTGPVQERVYAQHAGLGWIGKNTCVINPEVGSWIFLSAIICSLDLQPDAPALDQCGTCTLCLDACPTGALAEPYVLDSRLCLSYLTIELKGAIPLEQREAVGRHAYGCDICQEVCPWNLAPSTGRSSEPAWAARPGLDGPRLLDLWRRSDDDLRTLLKGSAMKRAGVKRLRRNIAVALGNSGDPAAREALRSSSEETARDPLVAEHVAWAVEKLDGA
ncbi:MAG: tRNA epoxyqueuosine(34) reductase QueG [Acidobacteria bacterium]|nr:tRNA epoxyqueuosine(34) reductase QueG [Acidobacteriota bacterium]